MPSTQKKETPRKRRAKEMGGPDWIYSAKKQKKEVTASPPNPQSRSRSRTRKSQPKVKEADTNNDHPTVSEFLVLHFLANRMPSPG
jgi:hypothetical protein